MTRDQIIAKWNALEPRERDAWVEEVIFGDTSVLNVGEYWFCGGNLRFPLPFYTEDIAAAWTVVNETAKWGGMDIGCYGKPGAQFYVTATHTDTVPYQRTVSVTRSSAPEAICLAAIITKLSPAE